MPNPTDAALNVYLSLGFHLLDWDIRDKGEIWLHLQPFVGPGDLDAYINKTYASLQYTLAFFQDADGKLPPNLVPVNLPDAIDLVLDARPTLTKRNSRSSTRLVADPQKLSDANDQPARRDQQTQRADSQGNFTPGTNRSNRPLQGGQPVPFASYFNASLQDAWQGKTYANADGSAAPPTAETPDQRTARLTQMLDLTFLQGQAKIVPPGAIQADSLEPENLMLLPLPESDSPSMDNWKAANWPSGTLRASVHSLCGLKLLVGTKSDVASLNNLAAFHLRLIDTSAAGGQSIDLIGPGTAQETHAISFFKNLTQNSPTPDCYPTATWDDSWQSNVWVVPNRLTYSRVVEVQSPTCFRRDASDIKTPNPEWVRFTVAYRLLPTESPINDFPSSAASLHWQAYRRLSVKLLAYQNVIQGLRLKAGDKPGSIPLRMVPSIQDRDAFYALLQGVAQGDSAALAAWLANQTIYTSDGATLQQALNLASIGKYDFPWDDVVAANGDITGDYPTVLFFGQAPPSVNPPANQPNQAPVPYTGSLRSGYDLILLVPIGTPIVTPVTGVIDAKTLAPATDYFGPRWEANPLDLSSWNGNKVDWFELVDAGGLTQDQILRLKPSIAHRGDVNFIWAQSGQRLEGILTVNYPMWVTDDQHDFDPANSVKHDSTNYRELNVYSKWGADPRRFLNPWSQIYQCSMNAKANDAGSAIFRPTLSLTADGPIEYLTNGVPPLTAKDYAKYYDSQFSNISAGSHRTVSFELEHILGTTRPIANPTGDVPSYAWDPPYSLAVVAKQDTVGNAKPEDNSFLSIELPNGGQDQLILHFNAGWLSDAFIAQTNGTDTQDANRTIHKATWRAVAEAAYADNISLVLHGFSFDFMNALPAAANDPTSASLADGLIETVEDPIDITTTLQTLVKAWIQSPPAAQDAKQAVTINLPTRNGLGIGQRYALVAFGLLTKRRAAAVPAITGGWKLIEPLPTRAQGKGQDWGPVSAADLDQVTKTFSDYCQRLLSEERSLSPIAGPHAGQQGDTGPRATADNWRNALGTPSKKLSPSNREEISHWIVPAVQEADTDPDLVAAVSGLGFRPINYDPVLLADTDLVVNHYIQALYLAVTLALPDMVASKQSANDWKKLFDTWSANLKPKWSGSTVSLAHNLLSLHKPLYDTGKLRGDGRYAEAKSLSGSLGNEADSLRKAFDKWLASALIINPSAYCDAKALLATRLRGMSQPRVSKDFVSFKARKYLRKIGTNPDPGSLVAVDSSYRNKLEDPSAQSADATQVLVSEFLNEAVYPNQFWYDKPGISAPSFENLVHSMFDQSTPKSIPVFDDSNAAASYRPSIPMFNEESEDLDAVRLPSNTTLQPPLTRFLGKFDFMQSTDDVQTFSGGKVNDQQVTVATLLPDAPSASISPVHIIAQGYNQGGSTASPNPIPRAKRMDAYVYTGVFRIRGDENSFTAIDPAGCLDNDIFEIHFGDTPPSDPGTAATNNGASGLPDEANFKTIAKALSNISDVSLLTASALTQPVDLLWDSACLTSLLNRITPFVSNADPTPVIKAITISSQGKVEISSPNIAPYNGLCEAFFLQADEDKGTPYFYLVVNVEPLVWADFSLHLRQTRNAKYAFAPEFVEELEATVPAPHAVPLLIADISDNDDAKIVKWKESDRNCSIKQLIYQALYQGSPPNDPDEWTKRPFSITVFHEQRTSNPQAYVQGFDAKEGPPKEYKSARGRRLIMAPIVVTLAEMANLDNTATFLPHGFTQLLPQPYKTFQVEILWSDENTNMGFFRVANMRIEIGT